MSKAKELINELLVEVFNNILSVEEENLRNKGVALSMNEVHILEAINTATEPSMTNIAKTLRVTTGTLTTAINRLVDKDCVVRYTDDLDRRKVLLKLTPSAIEDLKYHDDFHNEMIEAMFSDLNIDQDETLLKSLENISDYFKEKYK